VVTATIPVGNLPYAIDENPYTNRIYVANQQSNTVSVISGRTSQVIATIPVGAEPYTLAVNPLTNRVFVTNAFSQTVSVISGRTARVVATVPVGGDPQDVTVNPVTNRVYVVAGSPGDFQVMSGQTDTVTATVSADASGLSVDYYRDLVYVANGSTVGEAHVISGRTDQTISSAAVGGVPYGIVIDPITDVAYTTNAGSNTVSVLRWSKVS
jgi:YVTN family beta-propeller protein